MRALAWAPRLLAVGFFGMQCALGGLTLLRPVAVDAWPALFRDWVPALQGMQIQQPPPVLTASRVLDNSFQKAADAWVGTNLFQRAAIVRTFNEALWRGFGTSFMASRSLVRGKGGTLYEQSYILAYCDIRPATNVAALPDFARRLRRVQDWFESRGQNFVYVLAPTKTAWFPDRIPPSFPCPAAQRDPGRASAVAAFKATGVRYVDALAAMERARGHVSVELFPRNGIHWNALGAAIGAQALLDAVREAGLRAVPDLTYDTVIEPDEIGQDRDLSDLLNLLVPPKGDRAPRVTVKPVESGHPLRLVAVNDSFLPIPVQILSAAHVFRSATVFGYLTLEQTQFEDGIPHLISMAEPDIVRSLLAADVVVLEEVESRIGGPFAEQFLDLIDREMTRTQAAKPPTAAQ